MGVALVLLTPLVTGCQAQVDRQAASRKSALSEPPPTTAPVAPMAASDPVWDADVEAKVCPPAGWTVDPIKRTDRHVHKTWLSATRETAYGVIHATMPLPLGEDLALWGFMREMKRSEGEAVLLDKQWDDAKQVMRFEAEGGLYHIRAAMTTKGSTAWVVYAGTLKGHTPIPAELSLAITAREQTKVGR